MRPLLLSLVLCGLVATPFTTLAQHITDDAGKTYYDEAQTQLKEVYSYKQVTIFNPRTSEGRKQKEVRHGPYFFYYRDGDIKISGRYKDGEKHGRWEHYTEDGTLKKVVQYKEGKQVSLNQNPDQPGEKPKDRETMEQELDGS